MIHLTARVRVAKLTGQVATVPKEIGGKMQVKTVYPEYEEQRITADEDYDGLSMVVVMPKPRPMQEALCTDVPPNRILSAVLFAPGGSLEEYIPKMYSYNGEVLPEIPPWILRSYPYAFITKGSTRYNLIFSKAKYYFAASDGTKPDRLDTQNATVENYWLYFEDYENGESWELRNTSLYYWEDPANTLIWSNYDIPNGSQTATEIYFEGTQPVLVE